MRRTSLVLLIGLLGGLFPAGATARAACGNPVYVHSYDVRVTPDSRSYRVGDTAVLFAEVTRKDSSSPEGDVSVGVALTSRRDHHVYAWGKTRGDGTAVLRAKLRRGDVRPGSVTLRAFAFKKIADAVCAWVYEYGSYKERGAFRVRP